MKRPIRNENNRTGAVVKAYSFSVGWRFDKFFPALMLVGFFLAVMILIYPVQAFAGPYDGAVSYWSFDDGSGTAVTDSGTGGNTGNLVNMDPGTDWVAGKVGSYALDFDGGNDWVDVTGDESQFDISTGNISVALWVKAQTTQATNFILIDKSHGGQNPPSPSGWLLQGGSAGTVFWGYGDGGDWDNLTNTTTNIKDNAWHYIVGTYDGTTLRVYVDNVEENSYAVTAAPVDNDRAVEIASWWGGGSRQRYFSGFIDEVAVWDRALDSGEIATLYNGGDGYAPVGGGGSVPELPPYVLPVLAVVLVCQMKRRIKILT